MTTVYIRQNQKSDDMYIVTLLGFPLQVVAGINYYLDVEVLQSGCTSDCKVRDHFQLLSPTIFISACNL